MKNLLIFMIIFLGIGIHLANAQEMGNTPVQPEETFPITKENDFIQKLEYSFKLKTQQNAEVPEENLRITFLDVFEDSRCPVDVTCAWTGKAGLTFKISKDSNQEIVSVFSDDPVTVFGKYHVEVIDLNPHPISSTTIANENYVVVLKVTVEDNVKTFGSNDGIVLLSPLKQFKSGIPIEQIQCKEGLELVIKAIRGSPACVKPQSISALLIRGWSMQGNEHVLELSAGQRAGSIFVQEIFSDHISGMNFMEYPISREDGFPIVLYIGETVSNGCTVEMTLLKINESTATFLKKEYFDRPCPICLSEDTMIDTPNGIVNVKELKEGMEIFTQDAHGTKSNGTILETGKTRVTTDHRMIHIVLIDNRELTGSPNHPTAEGKVLGELQVGDNLDGSVIKFTETIQYNSKYTYDILPSGSTGYYWANGILIKSTLN